MTSLMVIMSLKCQKSTHVMSSKPTSHIFNPINLGFKIRVTTFFWRIIIELTSEETWL